MTDNTGTRPWHLTTGYVEADVPTTRTGCPRRLRIKRIDHKLLTIEHLNLRSTRGKRNRLLRRCGCISTARIMCG